jgi:hypothetical protein
MIMRPIFLATIFGFLSFTSFCQDDQPYPQKDRAALQALPLTFARCWNNHNMDSMGTMLTDDSVSIRYVKSDLATIHVGWGITGDLDPDGTPRKPRHGIFTWIVIKQKGRWLLLVVSNVNIRASAFYCPQTTSVVARTV